MKPFLGFDILITCNLSSCDGGDDELLCFVVFCCEVRVRVKFTRDDEEDAFFFFGGPVGFDKLL